MWIYFVLRSCWFAPIHHQRPQKYFRRKQGVFILIISFEGMYPQQSACGDASLVGCSELFSSACRNSLAVIKQFRILQHCGFASTRSLSFFFYHPWGVLPQKQTSPATGPTSVTVFCTDLPWNSACLLSTVILPVLQEVLDSADACCEIMFVVIYTLAF